VKAIAYYRVSTAAQGRSGLGLEAQQAAVQEFCRRRGAKLLDEFVEVESGSLAERPQLARALELAHLTGATLLIAKLDRLSRNAAFLLTLRDSGTEFIAVDMPDANSVTVGIMAVIAEEERRAISARTKAALAAAKARGVKLGNPNGAAALRRAAKGTVSALDAVRGNAKRRAEGLASKVAEIRASGANSNSAIAAALNDRQIRTPRGGNWHATSVRRLLERIDAAAWPRP
jgi:DNA invertase Pin-like site-specific DNA recombinase